VLTASETARALEEMTEQEMAVENRRVIEEQAYLRFTKYGILPEGSYAWYPKSNSEQASGRATVRR
jgi:hypothetical protein